MPVVFNFYFDLFADRKPYRQAAAVRHCLKGILHQVHYHHFEVGFVAQQAGLFLRRLEADADAVAFGFIVKQRYNVMNA